MSIALIVGKVSKSMISNNLIRKRPSPIFFQTNLVNVTESRQTETQKRLSKPITL